MGLLESCSFYAHSRFYQMIGTDHLCRLSNEKAMGQKEEDESSIHLAPKTQLWFDAQSLDAAKSLGDLHGGPLPAATPHHNWVCYDR